MKETDDIIKKVTHDRDGDAFIEMLCLPDKELKNAMNRMREKYTLADYVKGKVPDEFIDKICKEADKLQQETIEKAAKLNGKEEG